MRILALLLACCLASAVARSEEKIELRVQGLPNAAAVDPDSIAKVRLIEEFQRRFPNIELKPATGLQLETITPEATTIMMIAGGIAPDVIQISFRSVDTFVQQGMLLPLDKYIAEEKAKGDDIIGQVLPQIRPVIFRTGPDGKKSVYGLPTEWKVTGLFYNRELFRLAGLPQRPPADWNELREFSRKIAALGPQYRGLRLYGGNLASTSLINFIWSAGGEAVEEIKPGEWRAAFNTPAALDAYLFYYELAEIDRSVLRTTSRLQAQELERIGMMFLPLGDTVAVRDIVPLNPETWSFGVVPEGPTGKRGAEIYSGILGIFSGIKDEKKQRAAWEYIKFFTSEDAHRLKVATLVELGMANQINPVILRKFGYDQYLELAPKGLEEEFLVALKNAHPEPYGRNCSLVYNEMTYPLDQILLSSSIRSHWLEGKMDEVRKEAQDILNRAVETTNERMIGYIAPEEMAMRRRVAAIVLAVIITIFCVVGWYISRIFTRAAAIHSRPVSSRSLIPWLCLLPAFALVLLWNYIPLARGTAIAFLDYKLVLKSLFVGLDNFAIVLFDRTFWNSVLATLHFAAWTLTIGFATPVLLAYALHLIPKYKIFYRTVYYLPAVISGTAVFFLWRELFGASGFLNEILRFLGFEARRAWTEDPNLAMLSCVIPGIWASAGPGCLIYLAALKTIPEEQFEASEIDGAGFLSKTLHIVFPGLKALIIINFIGAVALAFHGATNILIMTGGGPNGITEVSSLLIFYEAFTRLRFGPATAMAWILGSMLIGFTVIQLKRLSQMEFKTVKK